MGPIRVGIIGLSTASEGTNWAVISHLPYLQSSEKYEIVALCNSSVEKAKASIDKYNLSSSTKAYGSPTDLANDKDVDLAVCVVGVERHYEVLKPMLEAGKDVYTELPLAQTMDQVRELEALAREKRVRTMFGMQGQANPVIKAVKRTVDEGKLGKILTVNVTAYEKQFAGNASDKGRGTVYIREVGANFMTVWFLHTFNYILHPVGEVDSFNSVMGITHPKIPIYDAKDPDKKIVDTWTATSPDQILIHGRLQSGALFNYGLHGGEAFPGESALKWHIVGDKGELLITGPMAMMDIAHAGTKIQYRETGSQEVSDIEIPADPAVDSLDHPSQNVGRLYEAFADGKTDLYADWKLALRRHELMDEMFKRWDGKDGYGIKLEHSKNAS